MKKLLLSFSLLLPVVLYAQTYNQYFDGADTSASNSIFIELDTASGNVWQVGKPQKVIFDSAATEPNVIVTDTLNNYPTNNTSRFSFMLKSSGWGSWGILAVRWKQKLDMDTNRDGGIVEYSVDDGVNWINAFNSPDVYNFYGFQQANKDTLLTGEYAFSGTDSTWRDIWLCFDISFLNLNDSVRFRFTLQSDSTDNNREGWMIDNITAHRTWVHTVVKRTAADDYLRVYPTNTTGIINIEAKKLQEYHIIESMQLMDMQGRIVQTYGHAPTKYYIDISNHANGMYRLKINTNKKSETFPVILSR